jgi:uncharacterized protein with NRDE domain
MCLLLAAWRRRSDLPLVLAANRDEAYERPFTGPEAWRAGTSWALAPRDLRAGGTWLGAAARGLVVVITNRRDGDHDPERSSRGLLCRAALGRDSAAGIARWLPVELEHRRTNSFNLLFADRRDAFVASWNGALEVLRLSPGVHALSNEHELGELALPGPAADTWELEEPELRARLAGFLAAHAALDARGFRICKHGEEHGTVSAALIFLAARGAPDLHWAPGPPCRTAFARCSFPAAVVEESR